VFFLQNSVKTCLRLTGKCALLGRQNGLQLSFTHAAKSAGKQKKPPKNAFLFVIRMKNGINILFQFSPIHRKSQN
jgi:hypothetical protein